MMTPLTKSLTDVIHSASAYKVYSFFPIEISTIGHGATRECTRLWLHKNTKLSLNCGKISTTFFPPSK